MLLISVLLQLAGLIPAAAWDIRTRTIPDEVNLPVLAAAVLNQIFVFRPSETAFSWIFTLALAAGFVLLTWMDEDAMGGGDMKLILSLSAANGFLSTGAGLLLSLIPALFYGRIAGRKHLPLAPFLLLGFGMCGMWNAFLSFG